MKPEKSLQRNRKSIWRNNGWKFPKFKKNANLPGDSYGKEPAWNAGELCSIPGLGIAPGEGNGNPLQYSYLENSMDRGVWWAIAHRVAESDTTRLSDTFTHTRSSTNTIRITQRSTPRLFIVKMMKTEDKKIRKQQEKNDYLYTKECQ